MQVNFRIVLGTLIERIHKPHRLAKTKWQAQGDALANPFNYLINTPFCVVAIDSVLCCHYRLLVA